MKCNADGTFPEYVNSIKVKGWSFELCGTSALLLGGWQDECCGCVEHANSSSSGKEQEPKQSSPSGPPANFSLSFFSMTPDNQSLPSFATPLMD